MNSDGSAVFGWCRMMDIPYSVQIIPERHAIYDDRLPEEGMQVAPEHTPAEAGITSPVALPNNLSQLTFERFTGVPIPLPC